MKFKFDADNNAFHSNADTAFADEELHNVAVAQALETLALIQIDAQDAASAHLSRINSTGRAPDGDFDYSIVDHALEELQQAKALIDAVIQELQSRR